MPYLDLEEMTNRQLLQHLARASERMEYQMSDLSDAVAKLDAAVDRVGAVVSHVGELSSALASVREQFDALTVEDEDVKAQLAAALADAESATASIQSEVSELDGLGSEPAAPVDDTPAPPVDDAPADPAPVDETPAEPAPVDSAPVSGDAPDTADDSAPVEVAPEPPVSDITA